MYIEDFSTSVYGIFDHGDVKTVSIGWLGDSATTTGNVPSDFIHLLEHLYQRHSLSELEMGYHDCEICDNYISHGQLWLEIEDTRYIMPMMILHYIQKHQYSPPKEFIDIALAFWHSDAAVQCRNNTCNARPIDFCEGFHGEDYSSAQDA